MRFNSTLPADADLITFQFSLVGYRTDQGDQDHLVKWVNAPTKTGLEKFIASKKLKLDDHGIDVVGPIETDGEAYAPYDEHIVDVEIDRDGNVVRGKIGITKPMTRSPRSDRGKPRKKK